MEPVKRLNLLLSQLEQEPDDVFLNYALGMEYASGQNPAAAESQFKKVIGFNADYIAAYYQLGKLYEAQSNIPEALNFYRTGLEKARIKKDHKAINEFGEAIFMLEED